MTEVGIRNIIFDMGQVIIRWQPGLMMDSFDVPEQDRALLLPELFQSVEWVQMDRGSLTEAEVTARVCARLPERLHAVAAAIITGWWDAALLPQPGMGELVAELKERGYGIYLLSNAGISLREYFPRIPGAACFDGLMVSAEEKLLKPQPEIYHRLYEHFGLDPAQCFFIDDVPANIEGALTTGMRGTIFRGDITRLRRELAQAGIL